MTATGQVRALLGAWLTVDFFADNRRTGGQGSSLSTTIFTQAFLALVFAALLYPETPPLAYAAANLSLSTLLVGIGVLGEGAHSSRADDVLLATAPVRRSTLVLARVLHSTLRLCLPAIGMALPAGILLGFLHGFSTTPLYLLAAVVCAGLLAGGLATFLLALERVLGVVKAQLAAGTLKAVLLGGGVAGFALCMRHLRGTVQDLPAAWLAPFWPPYHAARFVADPVAAWTSAVLLLGAGAVLFLVATMVGRVQRMSTHTRTPGRSVLRRALLYTAGQGPLRAMADFTGTMLVRSPGFRSRVLPLFGIPVAMLALAAGAADPKTRQLLAMAALQFPAIFLPFLVAFLPRADQPAVAWVFTSSPKADLGLAQHAAKLALVFYVLIPALISAAIVLPLLSIPVLSSWTGAAFALGCGILVTHLTVRRLPCIPFTEDVDRPETALDFGSLLGAAVLLTALGLGMATIANSLIGVVVATLVLALSALLLRRPAEVAAEGRLQLEAVNEERVLTSHGDTGQGPAGSAATLELTRELRAILVLYVAIAILPVLIGVTFAP